MSEPKLISPLLDGFLIGTPISEHDGVCCYPAMKENSDEKYIVKVLSVPASQVQLEALLLTGAYKDPSDAMDYFKATAEGVVQEAESLKNMSKLEGFLSYEDWQIVPMEDGKLGYQVYLLSTYKRSLEKYLIRNGITHLEAVNLGLDLCQALTIARRCGFMYVDIKPTNIFISKEKGYRIGDLGFIPMDSLQYTSLPAKYRSPYSAPEAQDDLNTLNQTVDTYAVGMLLYQIYNDSSLPKIPENPKEALPSPANADYELAEIIMKAIARDPADRWQSPIEMGQALVAYMQRNSVNNTPIAAPRLDISTAETIVLPDVRTLTSSIRAQNESDNQAPAKETVPEVTEDTSVPDAQPEEAKETVSDAVETKAPQAEEPAAEEKAEPAVEEVPVEAQEDDVKADTEDALDFTKFLEIKHQEAVATAERKTRKPKAPVAVADTPKISPENKRKGLGKGIIWIIVTALILGLLGAGAYFYYQNIYLITVDDLSVEGTQNLLTVHVDGEFDENLLSVRCIDSYGNGITQPIINGEAVFAELLPGSLYRIELQVSGFHDLAGKTSEIFTTDSLTEIVVFNAAMGPEDGSVVLSFTAEGPEPEEWIVTCNAGGEIPVDHTFTGHSVTVRGLTVGKDYSFTLSTADKNELLGQTTVDYTVSRMVTAEELTIVSCVDGQLTVTWKAPTDVAVDSWTVRCYDDNGYDNSQETTETQIVFSDIDTTGAYTVEVTATGMSQPTRTSITANPITVSNLTFQENDQGELIIGWDHTGADPEGGWYLMYSIDNSLIQNIVKSETASISINPRVFGATYTFEIQAADGTSIFNNRGEYTCENVKVYEGHGLSAEKITADLLVTPVGEWTYDQVGKDVFTDTFAPGDSISMVLRASVNFYLDREELDVLYVIRDSEGNVMPELMSQQKIEWNDLWFAGDYHAGELDIPKVPDKPGTYSISVYFNNRAVTSTEFTISE